MAEIGGAHFVESIVINLRIENGHGTTVHCNHRETRKVVRRHREEIPGVNTQGRTLAEARRNLKEALQLVLDANRELFCRDLGIPLPA